MKPPQLNFYITIVGLSASWFFPAGGPLLGETPELADPDLEITLFAEDPEIVTPIGMAIRPDDSVFVIESHTHSPPDGYEGPDGDRIKVFRDRDDDGRADSVEVFAEGIHQAMNLAFSPDDDLYVVCAREVLRLVDHDHDGVCDEKRQILKLDTRQRYAHNSLLGITFDRDGWMYIARGNVGSNSYRFVGQDETFVDGYGDGGNVIRCRPDGTELTEFATGFWNPFDLKFDRGGRLLLVDNDPDARGPNRLVHVVHGGDYGYKSMFGGAGTHAYQGWDGSLPGTLPYLAGTGEAPSGLIDCRQSSFPSRYRNSILATVWNEHTIERFDIDPSTGGLAEKSVLVRGEQDFRPVALACDSAGHLFVTDWVRVDYPNHGRGRIWRISVKDPDGRVTPEGYFDPYQFTAPHDRHAGILAADGPSLVAMAETGKLTDPFDRHCAVMRLAESEMKPFRMRCLSGEADVRMLGLLASRHAGQTDPNRIVAHFSDPDVRVRIAALLWAGETMDLSLADSIGRSIEQQPVTPELFETYLATAEVLTPEFVQAFRSRSGDKANKIPRNTDPTRLINVANNADASAEVRRLAVERFDAALCETQFDFLCSLLRGHPDLLATAAIDAIVRVPSEASDGAVPKLVSIANDVDRSAAVRTHAIAALAEFGEDGLVRIEALAKGGADPVSTQARRSLASVRAAPPERSDGRPSDNEGWRELLSEGGNALLGRHVFHDRRIGCSKCHSMDGRGGTLGPGLGNVSRSKTRRQIIDAILEPSAEFAPQYQAWMVLTADGTIHRGLQLDHKAKGAIVLTLESGENRYFAGEDVEAYRALPTSLMPSGLADQMTVGQFRDLIAYLVTLD